MTPIVGARPKILEDKMFRFLSKLENVFAAAAFAECGLWETAQKIAREKSKQKNLANKHKKPPRPRARMAK